MMQQKGMLLKSHTWWMEKDKAWFVSTDANVLFEVDMSDKKICALSRIQGESFWGYNRYPNCIKYDKLVYCIPAWAKNKIQCYDLEKMIWSEINVDNPANCRPGMVILEKRGNIAYTLAKRLKKILIINLKNMRIENTYDIAPDEKIGLTNGILVDDCVYALSASSPRMYAYNLITKDILVYDLPVIEDCLNGLCFDGRYFWLSGFRKRLYIWDKEKNVISELTDFLDEFGLYQFDSNSAIIQKDIDCCGKRIFGELLFLNGNIWMIPNSGSSIMYCDKNERVIKSFEIHNEEETMETLQFWYRTVRAKFRLQYIREDRYLGIYSPKNRLVFEIDTLDMTYNNMTYNLDMDSVVRLLGDSIFFESPLHSFMYEQRVNRSFGKINLPSLDNGGIIWKLTGQD